MNAACHLVVFVKGAPTKTRHWVYDWRLPSVHDHDGVLCQSQALEPGRVRGVVPCPCRDTLELCPRYIASVPTHVPHLPEIFSVFNLRLPYPQCIDCIKRNTS